MRRSTGRPMDETQRFVEAVRQGGTPMWVRHVVVPGRTDSADPLRALRAYVDTLPNVRKVELLPYHKLGENKYEVLGIAHPLAGTPPMDKTLCASLQQQFFGDLGGRITMMQYTEWTGFRSRQLAARSRCAQLHSEKLYLIRRRRLFPGRADRPHPGFAWPTRCARSFCWKSSRRAFSMWKPISFRASTTLRPVISIKTTKSSSACRPTRP